MTLRQEIIVLDRPNISEMTIREYLQLSATGASAEFDPRGARGSSISMDAVSQLADRASTRSSPAPAGRCRSPRPCSSSSRRRSSRSRACSCSTSSSTSCPKEALRRSLDMIQGGPTTTVIYFSNRDCAPLGFDLLHRPGRGRAADLRALRLSPRGGDLAARSPAIARSRRSRSSAVRGTLTPMAYHDLHDGAFTTLNDIRQPRIARVSWAG